MNVLTLCSFYTESFSFCWSTIPTRSRVVPHVYPPPVRHSLNSPLFPTPSRILTVRSFHTYPTVSRSPSTLIWFWTLRYLRLRLRVTTVDVHVVVRYGALPFFTFVLTTFALPRRLLPFTLISDYYVHFVVRTLRYTYTRNTLRCHVVVRLPPSCRYRFPHSLFPVCSFGTPTFAAISHVVLRITYVGATLHFTFVYLFLYRYVCFMLPFPLISPVVVLPTVLITTTLPPHPSLTLMLIYLPDYTFLDHVTATYEFLRYAQGHSTCHTHRFSLRQFCVTFCRFV